MSPLLSELLGMGCVSVLFLLLFGIGEFLRKKVGMKGEFTRKIVHFGGCVVALSFPYLFQNIWSVFALCVVFTLIIFFSARFSLLASVHDVDRKSYGGIYHPIAIFLSFLICSLLHRMLFFQIGIMVLALSDSMAAIIGKIYGRNGYDVEKGNRKSIEGSVIFFLLTFLITHLALLLLSDMGRIETVLVAVLVAVLVTLFEAISLDGADNLFIPLGTIVILAKNAVPDTAMIAFQLLALASTGFLLFLIMRPFRKIGVSGYIALTLAAYTGWGLVDVFWMLPFLYCVILICRTDWVIRTPDDPETVYRVQPTFYLIVAPVIWLLLANLSARIFGLVIQHCFFASMITALTAQMVIQRTRRDAEYSVFQLVRDVIVLVSIPVLLIHWVFPGTWLQQLIQVAAVYLITLVIGGIWYGRGCASKPLSRKLLQMRMLLTFIGSALPAAANLLYFFLKG